MSGYGVPPGPPRPPAPSRRPGQQLPLFDLIGAGLGVLSFIWGFLDWYGQDGASAKGYAVASPAAAAIGLSILAGAIGAIVLLDRSAKPTLVPAAAAIAALLVTIGLLVDKGDGIDTKIGLILELITAVVQAAVFIVGWLQANGRLALAGGLGGQRSGQHQQQWAPPPQPQAPYGYPGGMPGGMPGGGYGPPQQPPGYPPPPQPPGYGPPQPPPGYGQPTHHQMPPAPPQRPQPQPPQPHQPTAPLQPQPNQPRPNQPPPPPPHESQQPPGYDRPPENPYGQQQR